jgi:hypothetical protein
LVEFGLLVIAIAIHITVIVVAPVSKLSPPMEYTALCSHKDQHSPAQDKAGQLTHAGARRMRPSGAGRVDVKRNCICNWQRSICICGGLSESAQLSASSLLCRSLLGHAPRHVCLLAVIRQLLLAVSAADACCSLCKHQRTLLHMLPSTRCSLFDFRLPEFSLISATSSAHLTLCTVHSTRQAGRWLMQQCPQLGGMSKRQHCMPHV